MRVRLNALSVRCFNALGMKARALLIKGLSIMPFFELRGTEPYLPPKVFLGNSTQTCLKAKTSKTIDTEFDLVTWGRGSSRGVEARDDRWLHVRDMPQGLSYPARPQDAQDQKAPRIRHLRVNLSSDGGNPASRVNLSSGCGNPASRLNLRSDCSEAAGYLSLEQTKCGGEACLCRNKKV